MVSFFVFVLVEEAADLVRGGLVEGFFHDLYVLDLEEMANLGVDKFHHLFLAALYVFKELFLSLQIPVNSALVELDKSYKLSGAAYYE